FVLFFLLLRHLLDSTLFPYTTLFRSLGDDLERACVRAVVDRHLFHLFHGDDRDGRGLARRLSTAGAEELRHRSDRNASISKFFRDRKSTRLNSSHDQISYAVFCLKKK